MTAKTLIQTMFGYHYWANARIIAQAGKVDKADFYAPSSMSHGSLHALLFHTMSVDYSWRHACQFYRAPEDPLELSDFPGLDEIVQRWQIEEQAMRQYLESIPEDQVESTVQVTDWKGRTFPLQISRMLMHIIMHGMQHRSEAAALLTNFGQSPGDMDFMFYRGN